MNTLDLIYTYSAIEQPISVLFIEDGVHQLQALPHDDKDKPNITKMLQALPELGIDKVYVCEQAILRHGITMPCIPITPITPQEISTLMHNAKTLLR